jgi:two-component system sensor histidine kinase/response regulator
MGRLISLRSSIHKKILLLMLGLALPPMLLVGWMGLMSLERARALVVAEGSEALRAQAEQTLEQRAADKARLYDQSLHTIQQQVVGVARYAEHLLATSVHPTSSGQVWIAPDGPDERALTQHSAAVAQARHLIPLLDTTVQHNPLLTLGYIAFEDGGVLAFNDEAVVTQLQTIAPFDPRERPWYRGALERGETFWTDLYVDANTQTPTITCAAPVRNPQGEIIGVVGFDMLLTTVKQDLQDVLIGDISANGYAQLLDHTGALLAHPELAPAATRWNEPIITENWQTSSNRELRAVAQQMLARESGIVQITRNAERVYIAFAPITTTGWSIALVIPANDIEQPAINTGLQLAQSQEQFQTRLLLLLVVSALLICVVGILMAHSFTRPIRALRHSAHRVAGGHLDQQLPPTGTDEIGELVQAFNTMTSALQQKVAELEANARQLMLLNTVSNQLKTMLDLPHLLEMIPRIVCEQFGFARAVLYLVEDDILRVAAASFGPGNEAQARHFVEVANATLFSLDSAAGVVEHMHAGQSDSAMRNSHPGVQIPIVGRDERVIGLLSAERSDPAGGIPPQMRGQLQMFANMAGLTIENVRLYDDLERQVAQRTAELRSALERVQLADRRKSDFLAAVSHELRTPLNAIIGFSAVLLDDPDHPLTPVQREDMQSIYSNGRFLLNLITDLLDLARIEAGHLKLDRSPVELAPLIDEVVDTVEGLRQEGDVRLLLDLPDDLPQVDADADRVRQILLNLLSNAVKFTERGAITISAHQPQAAYLSITVADTGIGIPLERQHQLFDEFSQFHGRRSRTHGTGLGLAITRRLVEAHGGTIRVESVPGRGSSFTFTLPTCMQMLMVGMITEHHV